jgi:transposase
MLTAAKLSDVAATGCAICSGQGLIPKRDESDSSRFGQARAALEHFQGLMRQHLRALVSDADRLRRFLRETGSTPVIPGRRNRKRTIRYDQQRYRDRHLVENAFCRLKDFRRIATRHDKLAANFLSGLALATALAFEAMIEPGP